MTTSTKQIDIHLKYEGPDLGNGKMAIEDVIPVLQGFSGAFSRLAVTENPNVTLRIELSDVKQGSADIVLEIHEWLVDSSVSIAAVAGLTTIGGMAFLTVKKVFEVIRIKKHVGAGESNERISANNGIVVINSNNVEINVTPPEYNVYKNRTIDKDLELLTRPLQEGKINSAEFEVRAENHETLRQKIMSEDRPHFEIKDLKVTTTKEKELIATLNSLTKSTNSGWLKLPNKKRLFYRYIGDDYVKLHSIFGNYSGPVKILCREILDENSNIKSLEILTIDRMQMEMFG